MEEHLYHGTSMENALNIVKTQYFEITSDNENKKYLGTGAYFYFNFLDAIEWNNKVYWDNYHAFPSYNKLVNDFAIIETKLDLEKINVLNLDNREDIIKYKIIVKNIKEELRTIEDYNDSHELATIINYLYKKNLIDDIDAIQKTFPFPIPKSFGARNIQKTMICIKKIEILSKFYLSTKINIETYNKIKILFT